MQGGYRMTAKCFIYQARNGLIYISTGSANTQLTEKQVNELRICVYNLEDFDYDLYQKAYAKQERGEAV